MRTNRSHGTRRDGRDYSDLDREHRDEKEPQDLSGRWEGLKPIGEASEDRFRPRIEQFCERKGISFESLQALGARYRLKELPPEPGPMSQWREYDVELAYALPGRLNGSRTVTGIKFRCIDGVDEKGRPLRRAEDGSTCTEPVVFGDRSSDRWFVAESETDAARIWDLTGGRDAILVLPWGAKHWKPSYADPIPRGAEVLVALDADEDGDDGAGKVARSLGGRAARLRPPEPTEDWAAWVGNAGRFEELVRDALEAEEGSNAWAPIDIVTVANEPPSPPTLCGIAYPGVRHVFSGEPETAKSWLALVLSVEEIGRGRNVLWVDFNENGARAMCERVRQLGLDDETIRERFLYVEPDRPIAGFVAYVRELVAERRPAVSVVDAGTGGLSLHGFDSNSDVDIDEFYATVVAPLRSEDGASIVVEHLGRDTGNRGVYVRGSGRKVEIPEVHLSLSVVNPFGRGRTGLMTIKTKKDRPGYLPRPNLADFELRSDPDTGAVTWTLRLNEFDGEFAPTEKMEAVSEHMREVGRAESRNAICVAVGGKRDTILLTIRRLLEGGYLTEDDDGIHFARSFNRLAIELAEET
jgi:hypothetical protein